MVEIIVWVFLSEGGCESWVKIDFMRKNDLFGGLTTNILYTARKTKTKIDMEHLQFWWYLYVSGKIRIVHGYITLLQGNHLLIAWMTIVGDTATPQCHIFLNFRSRSSDLLRMSPFCLKGAVFLAVILNSHWWTQLAKSINHHPVLPQFSYAHNVLQVPPPKKMVPKVLVPGYATSWKNHQKYPWSFAPEKQCISRGPQLHW